MEVTFNYDDKEIEKILEKAKKGLTDMSLEAQNIEQYFGQQIQKGFTSMKDPQGQPWEKNTLSTLAYKARKYPQHKNDILQMKGVLRRSIYFSSGITAGLLRVNVLCDLKYFYTHQWGMEVKIFGRKKYQFPKREMVGLNSQDKTNIAEIIKGVWSASIY